MLTQHVQYVPDCSLFIIPRTYPKNIMKIRLSVSAMLLTGMDFPEKECPTYPENIMKLRSRLFPWRCPTGINLRRSAEVIMNQCNKSHNAPVPYPTMQHSEQKCAHFCSECCIVGYGASAQWDLWIWPINIACQQSICWQNLFNVLLPVSGIGSARVNHNSEFRIFWLRYLLFARKFRADNSCNNLAGTEVISRANN